MVAGSLDFWGGADTPTRPCHALCGAGVPHCQHLSGKPVKSRHLRMQGAVGGRVSQQDRPHLPPVSAVTAATVTAGQRRVCAFPWAQRWPLPGAADCSLLEMTVPWQPRACTLVPPTALSPSTLETHFAQSPPTPDPLQARAPSRPGPGRGNAGVWGGGSQRDTTLLGFMKSSHPGRRPILLPPCSSPSCNQTQSFCRFPVLRPGSELLAHLLCSF